ncbi:MAG: IS66 family transposase zinc-finger binding domain-containing protein [Rubrivivax sp.]
MADTAIEDEAARQSQAAARRGASAQARGASGAAGEPAAHRAPPRGRAKDLRVRPAAARIGEDVSEQLNCVPAQFFVHRHIRGKYACRGCQAISAAALPAR